MCRRWYARWLALTLAIAVAPLAAQPDKLPSPIDGAKIVQVHDARALAGHVFTALPGAVLAANELAAVVRALAGVERRDG
jgi:hypothetical protein